MGSAQLLGASAKLPVVPRRLTIAEITSIMIQRRTEDAYLIRNMIDVRDRYNGDVIIPLPDVEGQPKLEPPVARLIAQAIDNLARRAAGYRPRIQVPNIKPDTQRYAKIAETMRLALSASHEYNQLWDVKSYRSFRHFIGYGTFAMVVLPDEAAGRATIEIRDPLTAFPELRTPDDIRPPKNVGFIVGRSMDWILANYPEAEPYFRRSSAPQADTIWDIVEWIDENDIVIGIMGPRQPAYAPADMRPFSYGPLELRRWENKTGMCTAVVPRRVTLDRVMSAISPLVGTYDLMSRLASLQLIAGEKAVFPDLVILSEDPNQPAQIVSGGGRWQDGRTGDANILQGARGAQFLQSEPAPEVEMLIERLEAIIRAGTGGSALMEGQNPTSLRTGRAIAQMGEFSVDPIIAEAQKMYARSLSFVNEAVIATEYAYFPKKTITAFTGYAGDKGVVTYTPENDFVTLLNRVSYPVAGADVAQLSMSLSQLVGTEQLSRTTARALNPQIEDPDQEADIIARETLRGATLQALTQMAGTGQITPLELSHIGKMLEDGKTIYDAVEYVHQESQKRQATQAPPPGPGQTAPPQSQPGLGGPPGQPSPPVPAPPPSLGNLQKLVGALNAQPRP